VEQFDFRQLTKDMEFLTDMLLMTCSSSRITFGQGIESLEETLANADDDLRETCRNILRNALELQIGQFQEMYDRIDKSTGTLLT